jgi:glutaconyl-CoA/methylmalonyl-CoA decarboxylase subunit gamma
MKLRALSSIPEDYEVEATGREDGLLRGRVNGKDLELQLYPALSGAVLRLDGRALRVFTVRRRDSILVSIGPAQFEFRIPEAVRKRRGGSAVQMIEAPMPGKVLKLLVEEQQQVEAGAPLLVLEAMKMETTLYAEAPAVVAKIPVVAGQMVQHGAVLIELGPPPSKP